MENNFYDTIKANDKLEYPVVNKKDFIQAMVESAKYQSDNPTQIQKGSFYNKSTDGKKVQGIVIKNHLFTHCKFDASTLIRCLFDNCTFTDCSFTGCTLYNVKFVECSLNDCDFTSTDMQDVDASTSSKKNCKIGNINPDNNVRGFSDKDQNIITDQKQEQVTSSSVIVKNCIETNFKNFQITEDGLAYELTFPDDDNAGIALYQNTQKNSSDREEYWELDFFIGNESVLMSDFNFYGKTEEEITDTINNWMKTVLVQNGQSIMKNIISILNRE